MSNAVLIKTVNSDFLISRWNHIETILRTSFQNSTFNPAYTFEKAIDEITDSVFKKNNQHIVALKNDHVVGCVFSLKTDTPHSDIYHDIGWFFVDHALGHTARISTAVQIIEEAHRLLRIAGYHSIQTEMGTKEGEQFLSNRFGYALVAPDIWSKTL